ncbi:hypothetical protein PC9H_005416 [Pleurotus ostreatus]|uniref:Uncharacterized protein n=1 Tax=Pleurotus ostreatus TaxID=5322 RepID=A0A8H7DUC9_PLEOS|nr:uncharacterized protein PC9H_005416 [Pleurotus ostreatus]KAF7433464.1 hypothetical protein PC9H_005416 [Pleurotus ostreatus]
MNPDALAALLVCSLCRSTLKHPTTLRCGHTLCGGHVKYRNVCPLESCSNDSSSSRPNIPSTSRVAYHPPPESSQQREQPPALSSERKVDVVVNKLLALARRGLSPTETNERTPTPDHNDSDSDDGQSSTRPRKRRRRHLRSPSPPSQPSASTSNARHDSPESEFDLLSHLRHSSALHRSIRPNEPLPDIPSQPETPTPDDTRFDKELLTELTCEICFQLLYEPLTTPCQHTYCTKCLHRSLDHSPSCPLCRQDLPDYAYFQEHPENTMIRTIILQAFPEIYEERKATIEAEERDARLDTPIFVCQLSFPGIPTFLHFFEPRYRLMLRRCLESPHPCFGMVMPPRSGFSNAPNSANAGITIEYGTMLEIRSVQMLNDGRSMVETFGTHRFRILEKGLLDGYVVGRVERIDDEESDFGEEEESDFEDDNEDEGTIDELIHAVGTGLEPLSHARDPSSTVSTVSTSADSSSPGRLLRRIASSFSAPPPTRSYRPSFDGPSTLELMDTCKTFLQELERGTAPWVVQRLNNAYGLPPTDPAPFSFWVALVLPIEESEKAKLLPIRSARLRLRVVVGWIEQLRGNWWFTSGCTIL